MFGMSDQLSVPLFFLFFFSFPPFLAAVPRLGIILFGLDEVSFSFFQCQVYRTCRESGKRSCVTANVVMVMTQLADKV